MGVGVFVGTGVEVSVGTDVGVFVGTGVGVFVGAGVGVSVGTGVGGSVGTGVDEQADIYIKPIKATVLSIKTLILIGYFFPPTDVNRSATETDRRIPYVYDKRNGLNQSIHQPRCINHSRIQHGFRRSVVDGYSFCQARKLQWRNSSIEK